MSRPTSALGGESTGCHWLIRRISRTAASASSDTRGSCGRDQRCAPASRVGPFHLHAFWCVLYKLSGRWDLATSRVGLRRSFELTAARLAEEGIRQTAPSLGTWGEKGVRWPFGCWGFRRVRVRLEDVDGSTFAQGVDAPQRLVEPVSRSEWRRTETFHALILALESRRCPSLRLRETPSVCVLEQTQLARAGTCGQAPARGGRFTLALMDEARSRDEEGGNCKVRIHAFTPDRPPSSLGIRTVPSVLTDIRASARPRIPNTHRIPPQSQSLGPGNGQ